MFSGKTTELLRRLATSPRSSVLAFKHVIDRRYQVDAIVSHDGERWSAIPIRSAREIPDRVGTETKIVAVDEGHFFDLVLVEVARDLAVQGKDVIVTSLDRDSWGRRFTVADRLTALADEPVLRSTVCARCGSTADRTQRLTPIIDRNMVGGPESYEARCRSCWVRPPEPPPEENVHRHTEG
jgi:thymidine kinase